MSQSLSCARIFARASSSLSPRRAPRAEAMNVHPAAERSECLRDDRAAKWHETSELSSGITSVSRYRDFDAGTAILSAHD